MLSITYLSAASSALTPQELAHLVEQARRRNAEKDITGVLVYSAGTFVQTLEGPTAAADDETTPQGVAVTIEPLDDDEPGTGATFELDSVELFDTATGTWVKTLTVAGHLLRNQGSGPVHPFALAAATGRE